MIIRGKYSTFLNLLLTSMKMKNAKIADAREEIEAKLTLEFKEKLRLALERSLQLQNERMQEVEELIRGFRC